MFDKLKLAKQANDLKNNLAKDEVMGESSDGNVKITMNGNQDILNVEVEEELLSADKKSELQDDIKDAFKKALKEVQMLMIKKMQSGEIEMPNM